MNKLTSTVSTFFEKTGQKKKGVRQTLGINLRLMHPSRHLIYTTSAQLLFNKKRIPERFLSKTFSASSFIQNEKDLVCLSLAMGLILLLQIKNMNWS